MRIERFDAVDASRGMREINTKYGDDVLIIANTRVDGKIQFVIAIDTEVRPPKLFTPESLVEDFSGASASPGKQADLPDEPAPPEPISLRDSQDLVALMNAGFGDIKSLLEELRQQQSKPLPQIARRVTGAADNAALRLMRLFAGNTLPLDLLQSWVGVTSACAEDAECVAAIRSWLNGKLRDAPPFARQPGVHFLVGAHGVGKTVNGLRLAARLSHGQTAPAALFVPYKLANEATLSSIRIMGQRAGVNSLPAPDFPALVTLINEHISRCSLVIELPANLHASELLRLQQRLPSAFFHLVIAADSQVNDLQYVTREGSLTFSSALITRIDYQSVHWPLIHTLIRNDVPVMLGSHSGSVEQPLVDMDKSSIIDDAIRGISDKLDSHGSQVLSAFRSMQTLPTHVSKAEMM